MARDEPSFHVIRLSFCVSACPLLPQSSRSREIERCHRARRAEELRSNGVCSCDTRDRPRQPHRMSQTFRSEALD